VARKAQAYRVQIDFVEPLPITDEELALIEAHMGAIIAKMLEAELPETELPRQALAAQKGS
jgi:hypothetical protein